MFRFVIGCLVAVSTLYIGVHLLVYVGIIALLSTVVPF